MLRRLSLRNFILIHELSLDFQSGFTAITGETGSGKSILLNALGLIRGDRADFSTIGPVDSRATVEAVFESRGEIKEWLSQNSYEIWDDLIIRREISNDGRSRAFINDTPCTLNELRVLAEKLFIIHSQYHTLELKNQDYQRYILDALAGTDAEFQEYLKEYTAFLNRKSDFTKRQNERIEMESKLDYEQFILSEIIPLNLYDTDYSTLQEQLEHQEYQQILTEDLNHLISLSEGPMSNELSMLKARLLRSTEEDQSFDDIRNLLNKIISDLEEIGFLTHKKLAEYASNSIDEEHLLRQVDEFNRILNKHRLKTQEALISLQESLEGRLKEIKDLSEWISAEDKALHALETSLRHRASQLNDHREQAIPSITASIQEGLSMLKLSGSHLRFDIHRSTELNDRGMMDLSILFTANKGMEAIAIQKAASGGELSRVMLLLQQLISTKLHLPSVLFDEIDTGVSGDIAQRMGKLLRTMGEGRQLFAITHLPQVASQASFHLKVYKQDIQGLTQTLVSPLNTEERIQEIARLMSGDEINEGAILNAKKLMGLP